MAEKDVDIMLANWTGTAAHGFSISGSEEGIFIKDVEKNSPAGKSGIVKEGDQIISATIYFDNMRYEDAQKLLQSVDQQTVGLKLHRKGERLSPGGKYSWAPEFHGATSPDLVLSGDDEDYQRIYRKKIKPRLKSEDDLEAGDQGDTRYSIQTSRKVITHTGDISGHTVLTGIDSQDSELHIKVPRYEHTTVIRSGPKLEGSEMDVDVNLPEGMEGSLTGPNIQMDEGVWATRTTQVIKTKVISASTMDVPVQGPNISTSEVRGEFKSSKMQVFDVEDPKGNVKISGFHASKISVPGLDADQKGPNLENTSIFSTPKRTDLKTPKIDLKSSKFGISGPTIEEREPEVNISKYIVDVDPTAPRIDLSAPKFEADLKPFGVKANIDTPQLDTDVSFKERKITVPSTDISQKKFSTPDFDISLGGSKQKVNMDGSGKGVITGPGIDINVPHGHSQNLDGKITFDITKVKGLDWDPKLPKGSVTFSTSNTSSEMKLPGIDGKLEGPEVKIGTTDAKLSSFGISKPQISATGVGVHTTFQGDISDSDASKPNVHISAPRTDVDIRGPNVDMDSCGLDIDSSGKAQIPTFKPPKFGIHGSKGGGDVDMDVKFSDAMVDVSGPKIKGDIQGPGENVDLAGKGTGIKFPAKGFNVNLPHVITPNIEFTSKGQKPEGCVDVSLPKMEGGIKGDVKGAKLDIGAPNVSIEGLDTSGKVTGKGLKMPSFGFQTHRVNVPDVNLKGPNMKGGVHVSGPGVDVDIQGPKGDIDTPEFDGSGKSWKPKFTLPSFGIQSPKVEGPDVDMDFKVPDANVDLSGPKIKGGIEGPNVDLDLEGKHGKGKGFNINLPHFQTPKIDFSRKGQKLEGDIDVSLPEMEGGIKGDLKGPKLDLEGPDVNIDGPDASGKVKGKGFKMPSLGFHMPEISVPDFDLNLKGPNMKGGVDGSGIGGDVDIKGPKVDIISPEVDTDGSGKSWKPKFNLPSFGFQSPKVEGPDMDMDVNLPDVDISGPKIKGGIEGPDIDMDLEGPSGKGKGFNINFPKFKTPKIDFSRKGQKLEGDIDVSLPEMEGGIKGDLKGPKLDLEGPDVNIEGADASGKVKGKGFKMPSLGLHMPEISVPDFDLNLKSPNMKGVDISGPGGDVDIKGPKIDVGSPEVDINGSEKSWKPKFKLPGFGFHGLKGHGPDMDVDVDLPDANVDISGPKIKSSFEGPDVDVDLEGPHGKGKGIKFPGKGFNVNLPHIKAPNIEFSRKGQKVEGDIDVSLPDMEGGIKGDLKGPKLDIEAPDIDVEGFEVKGKGKSFTMPRLDIKMPQISGPKLEGDIKGPEFNAEGPSVDASPGNMDINVHSPEMNLSGKGKKGKFKIPRFNMGKPKMKVKKTVSDFDVSIPKGDIDLTKPEIDINSPEFDVNGSVEGELNAKSEKVKKPRFGKMKLSFPDIEFDLKSPKLKGEIPSPKIKGNFKTPSADISLDAPKIDLKKPEINFDVDAPNVDIAKPEGKLKMKMKKPEISGSKLEGESLGFDVQMKAPKVKGSGNVSFPEADFGIKDPKINIKGDLGAKAPNVNIGSPGGELKLPQMNISGPKLEGPNLGDGIKAPGVGLNLEMPDVDVSSDGKIKGPQISMPSIDISSSNVKGLDFDIKDPSVDPVGFNIKGPDGKITMPHIKTPEIGFSGPKLEGKSMDFDVNLPKTANVSSPKLEAPKIDIKGPSVNLNSSDINIGGSGGRLTMPQMNAPAFNMSTSGPKFEGGMNTPGVEVKGPEMSLTSGDFSASGMNVDLKAPKIKGGIDVSSPDLKADLKMSSFGMKAPKLNTGYKAGPLDFDIALDKVSIPKYKSLKLERLGPNLAWPEAETNIPDVQCPDLNIKAPKADVSLPEAQLASSGVKVKKSKIKFPRLNFSKSKGKGGDVNAEGSVGELGISKGSLGIGDIDLEGPSVSLSGQGSGLSTSPKSKSTTGEFSLFKSKRSSSLNDNLDLSPGSPKGKIGFEESAEGSVNMKGKKSKLKFGTFGSLGAKSKGTYEVTFNEDEVGQVEGSGMGSKKTRISSTSSSDSGSKAGLYLPKVELTVNKKKE